MREFELLKHVIGHNKQLPEAVTIPPGDDMAGLRIGDAELLVAVDQVIDQVHFDLAQATLAQVARKAITRNLSDVAAMAAVPVAILASVILPVGLHQDEAARLLKSLRQTAQAYGCPLIGGDTAVHAGPMSISVTVLAEPRGVMPVLRQGAQVGDTIYVTGRLGGSLHPHQGKTHHLDFEPRLAVARALASKPDARPTAMMDLSDGLARDLPHLVKGAEIDAAALPIAPVVTQLLKTQAEKTKQAQKQGGRAAWLHAVADGEDYELLFTARADAPIPQQIEGVVVTPVGQVCEASGYRLRLEDGASVDMAGLGWEHHG